MAQKTTDPVCESFHALLQQQIQAITVFITEKDGLPTVAAQQISCRPHLYTN